MIAYHGSQEVKDKYVARMKGIIVHGKLRKEKYGWWDGDSCELQNIFDSQDLDSKSIEIGIPLVLLSIQNEIFHALHDSEKRVEFALRFLTSIIPGSDLSLVWPMFALWMLEDPNHGARFSTSENKVESLQRTIALYRKWINKQKPTGAEFWDVSIHSAFAHERRCALFGLAGLDDSEAAKDAGKAVRKSIQPARCSWVAASKKLIQLLKDAPLPAPKLKRKRR